MNERIRIMHYNQAIEALRAAIERVDKVLSKKEWHTSEEREALDAMKQAFDDTAALEIDNATMMIMDLREVLWPIDNLNKEWSADTLDEFAEILRPWLPHEEQQAVDNDAETASTEELQTASDILPAHLKGK